MSDRPTFIDLSPRSPRGTREGQASPRGLPSPRVEHNAGDIPPELSPLDAFALQGRLLAKQLDESARNGRRVSRLPPSTIASSLAQARPSLLRSITAEVARSAPDPRQVAKGDSGSGTKGNLEVPSVRPISVHPRLSGMPAPDHEAMQQLSMLSLAEQLRARPDSVMSALDSPAVVPRPERSPKLPFTPHDSRSSYDTESGTPFITQQRSFDIVNRPNPGPRALAAEFAASRVLNGQGLVSLQSDRRRGDSSIPSAPIAYDYAEDEAMTMSASFASLAREQSSGSGISTETPPRSPFIPPPRPPRSPSVSSEYSLGGTRNIRGNFNFSRPISRVERPSFDTLSRQTSSDSQTYFYGEDTMGTPVSMHSEDNPDADQIRPVPSYLYSKFSLPRGRMLERKPEVIAGSPTHEQHHISFQQPTIRYSNVRPATPSKEEPTLYPFSPPRQDLNKSRQVPSLETSHASPLAVLPSPRPSGDSVSGERSDSDRAAVPTGRRPTFDDPSRPNTSSAASSSASTVRPDQKGRPRTASREMTAEQHLSRGIECHERGSVNESTYHLRIAARANNPTGMLLYALACRHGWGMRANPREGVQWLRKAVDLAGLEVADDEDLLKEGKSKGDILERRTRQAQFALSVYELGVSHMNGWGIEQDKALALRCFEIAGVWGDGDALAEAGFCYAQGVGCKKDLQKAARFYRQAEAKGMSMVGNSWIYKAKYNDDQSDKSRGRKAQAAESATPGVVASEATGDSPEKKGRDKSRTRTIFGRRKIGIKPPS